jgi:hypothetical protein
MCKLRAFAELLDGLLAERYGIADPALRRFRYGVQVNSLGLTEAQPENNVARIVIEMLAVTLSKRARARAVQLPAWNQALGLPRPWDQQWSLRVRQVLAYETDLLEYDDLLDGSVVVEAQVQRIRPAPGKRWIGGSLGWTVTPTEPSRWPSALGTAASKSSTRESGSLRPRSSPPRSQKTFTVSACRSCPDHTWSLCPRSSTACGRPARRTSRVVVGRDHPGCRRDGATRAAAHHQASWYITGHAGLVMYMQGW